MLRKIDRVARDGGVAALTPPSREPCFVPSRLVLFRQRNPDGRRGRVGATADRRCHLGGHLGLALRVARGPEGPGRDVLVHPRLLLCADRADRPRVLAVGRCNPERHHDMPALRRDHQVGCWVVCRFCGYEPPRTSAGQRTDEQPHPCWCDVIKGDHDIRDHPHHQSDAPTIGASRRSTRNSPWPAAPNYSGDWRVLVAEADGLTAGRILNADSLPTNCPSAR